MVSGPNLGNAMASPGPDKVQGAVKAITVTFTEYVTEYPTETMGVQARQDDGMWAPEATWAPAPTWIPSPTWTPVPSVSVSTAIAQPSDEDDVHDTELADNKIGIYVVGIVLGLFVLFALGGAIWFGIKKRGCSFFSTPPKVRKNKAALRDNADLEAGGSESDDSIMPPPRVVVNPGARPIPTKGKIPRRETMN
jgi:hypothetical protein